METYYQTKKSELRKINYKIRYSLVLLSENVQLMSDFVTLI